MIEQWFNKELREQMDITHRIVVCDVNSDGSFLLSHVDSEIIIYPVNNNIEELEVRYDAERNHPNDDVLFYVTMPKEKITFLQDYCQTCGWIDLSDMEAYIKRQLFNATGINPAIDKNSLVLAAKLSIGKDENWWKGVASGIVKPFDIRSCIVDFVCKPEETMQNMDETVACVFEEAFYKLIGKPQTKQKAIAMAKEAINAMFSGLLTNQISDELLKIYYELTDKNSAQGIMLKYVEDFGLPADVSPLKVHPDHPFIALDRKLTEMLSNALKNDSDTSVYLHAIHERVNSLKAQVYKADWLMQLAALFAYDASDIHTISSLDSFAYYYQSKFAAIDRAMRLLYVAWLSKTDTLRPIQYYYEQQAKVIQDKWYSLIDQYIPSQQGLVADALQHEGRIAVIVGDGLRLEIAEAIADEMKTIKQERKTAVTVLPSITMSGMSALYECKGIESSASSRFSCLKSQIADVEIMSLDRLNDSVTATKLVLTFGDIDQVGEKKQLSGLKDISNYHDYLTNAIKQLLSMGYAKVYLTTDHGFVITGILDEADKVLVPSGVDLKVEERYVLSNDHLTNVDWIERQSNFEGYDYQYYAKTDKPFVSRGSYGYAHGGLTPQECIIPIYCFSKDGVGESLKVTILNKTDLQSVTGAYFTIKIKGEGDAGSLFASSKRVKVQLFSNQGKLLTSSILNVNADAISEQEFELSSAPCKMVIIDVHTTEQLDNCLINKSQARDLEDLF